MATSTIPLTSDLIETFGSIDGSSFGKNFMMVNPTVRYDQYKQKACFFWDASTKSQFSNIPTTLNSVTGAVIGEREVFYRSSTHIFIRVTEFYPVPGRQHCNFYNNGSWVGWKTLTPT